MSLSGSLASRNKSCETIRLAVAWGHTVVLFAEKNDAVFQKAGENIVRALAAVGLFNDVRD